TLLILKKVHEAREYAREFRITQAEIDRWKKLMKQINDGPKCSWLDVMHAVLKKLATLETDNPRSRACVILAAEQLSDEQTVGAIRQGATP
ncbi:hypothetical protein ACUOIJ_25025, partial [Escherichia coli]